MTHLKELEYINLALNNIQKIEGLQNCEFIRKLDLTVNFIDFDELKPSVENLSSLDRLSELYMMGNPCQANWPNKFELYIIAKLPQLNTLDGKEITKSMRILALKESKNLEEELNLLAQETRKRKKLKQIQEQLKEDGVEEIISKGVLESDQLTENTPEVRVEIYKELAQQKKEKLDRDNENKPKQRDYEKEHQDSISIIRENEQSLDEQEIKQKNEGGWQFIWDEETHKGSITLELKLPKHLDSSLIDVDIHPTYVSVIIKGKLLRLRTPSEISVVSSKCQRSKLTGSLKIIMPKVREVFLIWHY